MKTKSRRARGISPGRGRKQAAERAAVKGPAKRPWPVREWLDTIVVVAILALFGTTFTVQAFEIPSGSMEDTLLIGERVIVDKLRFSPEGAWSGKMLPYREVRRGDIVVFRHPIEHRYFVKRAIGLPGDRVRLVDNRVQVNGRFLDEPYVSLKQAAPDRFRDNFPAVPPSDSLVRLDPGWERELPKLVRDGWLDVPEGHYFLLGDNRNWSLDSRYWGVVPRDNIAGVPLFIYWSLESSSGDFQYDSQLEWAAGAVKRVLLFPLKARWSRMFLPAG